MKYYEGLTFLKCLDRKTKQEKSCEYKDMRCNLYCMFGESCKIIFKDRYILTSWSVKSVEKYVNESEELLILTTLNSEYYFRIKIK